MSSQSSNPDAARTHQQQRNPISLPYLVRAGFFLTLVLALLALVFSVGDRPLLVSLTVLMAGVLILIEGLLSIATSFRPVDRHDH